MSTAKAVEAASALAPAAVTGAHGCRPPALSSSSFRCDLPAVTQSRCISRPKAAPACNELAPQAAVCAKSCGAPGSGAPRASCPPDMTQVRCHMTTCGCLILAARKSHGRSACITADGRVARRLSCISPSAFLTAQCARPYAGAPWRGSYHTGRWGWASPSSCKRPTVRANHPLPHALKRCTPRCLHPSSRSLF